MSEITGGKDKPSNEHQIVALTDRLVRWTKFYTLVTFLAVLVAIASSVISLEQLRSIKDGSVDTHSLAEAAKKQAVAAETNAITEHESFTASTRAWLDPGNTMLAPPEVGISFKIRQYYGNIGHSPASVGDGYKVKLYDIGEWKRNAYDDLRANTEVCKSIGLEKAPASMGEIFPTTTDNFNWLDFDTSTYSEGGSGGDPIVADEDLLEGRKILMFSACFIYEVDNRVRHTYVCSAYQANKPALQTKNTSKSGENGVIDPNRADMSPTKAAPTVNKTPSILMNDCGSYAD